MITNRHGGVLSSEDGLLIWSKIILFELCTNGAIKKLTLIYNKCCAFAVEDFICCCDGNVANLGYLYY